MYIHQGYFVKVDLNKFLWIREVDLDFYKIRCFT